MLYPGRRGLQSPSQLVPEARVNMAMRGWPRLDWNDPINQGMAGYWSMDGGTISGTTLADLSGSGGNGTLVNSPPLVPGPFGQALSFDGSTQIVTTPNIGASLVSAVSICGWINSNAASGTARGVLGQTYAGSNVQFFVGLGRESTVPATRLWAGFFNGSWHQAIDTSDIAINTWYSVCGTYDGSTINFYKNGQLVTSVSDAAGLPSSNSAWVIGRRWDAGIGNEYWSGALKNVTIYNRALSPAEINRLYFDTSGNLGLIVPTRRIVGASAATFKPAWVTQRNQVTGGYAT